MIQKERNIVLPLKWSSAWTDAGFTVKFVAGAVILALILTCYPYFFAFIQNRQGLLVNDVVLASIPPTDVSGVILTLICITTFLGLFRTLQTPSLFLVFLWGYVFMSLSRMITISLFPLEPPIGLIPLADPIAFPFYGHKANGLITKDLFYSGHTGATFLIYLVLVKKWEKLFALCATIAVGLLLMIQHVHYTIDVLVAPFFVYLLYLLAKKIVSAPIKL